MNDPCAICFDFITDPATLPCNHIFCTNCLLTWSRTGRSTCPMCRSPFTLETPVSNMTTSVTFMSDAMTWEDFVDYQDPGPQWVEFDVPEGLTIDGPVRTRRDLYRRLITTFTHEERNGRLARVVIRSYSYFTFPGRNPAPPGLLDHWRDQFVNLAGDDPNRIAFMLANSGLARLNIRSGADDTPPGQLFHCLRCSRFVTSFAHALDRHTCRSEFVMLTTHIE